MKARIKFHEMPGDIPRAAKIAMWEDPHSKRGGKAWKRTILSRERAVLKRRLQKETALHAE